MNVLLLTIPLSLLLILIAIGAFFWAVDHDQFDDMETPGLLPLDEERTREDDKHDEPRP
jgi:cbb3-type cytochrome oxidase maturation protein